MLNELENIIDRVESQQTNVETELECKNFIDLAREVNDYKDDVEELVRNSKLVINRVEKFLKEWRYTSLDELEEMLEQFQKDMGVKNKR